MTISTVNEHLLENIRALRGVYRTPHHRYLNDVYKRCNKRINFLLRMHRRHGRNQILSKREVEQGRIDPIWI